MYDVFKGYQFKYARKRDLSYIFKDKISLKQDLKPNDAKKKNLLIAIKRIESIQINPNEIFSYWKIIGSPSKKKGYVESRSLVNGKIENSLGGGLCQLSGLIYYISLIANLEILERHSHSMDIYTNATRFTPLGSDATVAYGYKDLKIRNNLDSPIKFKFSMLENHLIIHLMHSSSIQENIVEFKANEITDSLIEVTTIINKKVVDKSKYKQEAPNFL